MIFLRFSKEKDKDKELRLLLFFTAIQEGLSKRKSGLVE